MVRWWVLVHCGLPFFFFFFGGGTPGGVSLTWVGWWDLPCTHSCNKLFLFHNFWTSHKKHFHLHIIIQSWLEHFYRSCTMHSFFFVTLISICDVFQVVFISFFTFVNVFFKKKIILPHPYPQIFFSFYLHLTSCLFHAFGVVFICPFVYIYLFSHSTYLLCVSLLFVVFLQSFHAFF